MVCILFLAIDCGACANHYFHNDGCENDSLEDAQESQITNDDCYNCDSTIIEDRCGQTSTICLI